MPRSGRARSAATASTSRRRIEDPTARTDPRSADVEDIAAAAFHRRDPAEDAAEDLGDSALEPTRTQLVHGGHARRA